MINYIQDSNRIPFFQVPHPSFSHFMYILSHILEYSPSLASQNLSNSTNLNIELKPTLPIFTFHHYRIPPSLPLFIYHRIYLYHPLQTNFLSSLFNHHLKQHFLISSTFPIKTILSPPLLPLNHFFSYESDPIK